MTPKERFLFLHPNIKTNFIDDALENYYQKFSDLEVEELNLLTDIQKKAKSKELNYSNEYRINDILESLIETSSNEMILDLHSKIYVGVINEFKHELRAQSRYEDIYLIEMWIGFYSFLDTYSEIVSRIVLTSTVAKLPICSFKKNRIKNKIYTDIETGKQKLKNYQISLKSKILTNDNADFAYFGDKYTKNHFDVIGSKTKIAMTTFVLLHEIGHHVLNHTHREYSNIKSSVPNHLNFWENNNSYNEDQKEEFEADSFAISYILDLNKFHSRDCIIKFPEIETYLICALLILQSQSTFHQVHSEKDSHPPVEDRIQNLLSIMSYTLTKDKFKTIEQIFDILKYHGV